MIEIFSMNKPTYMVGFFMSVEYSWGIDYGR